LISVALCVREAAATRPAGDGAAHKIFRGFRLCSMG
jgi:hypothetical protein